MTAKYNLSGQWKFALDKSLDGEQRRLFDKNAELGDTIKLPSTTAQSGKGEESSKGEIWHLAEVYPFEGGAWFSKKVSVSAEHIGKTLKLVLERTRLTRLWIDGCFVGGCDSLCTEHIYDITDFVKSTEFTVTIEVRNVGYPTKGGHLTSPDTQTNWLGITGELAIIVENDIAITDVKTYPNTSDKSVTIKALIENKTGSNAIVPLEITAEAVDINGSIGKPTVALSKEISVAIGSQQTEITLPLGNDAELWSEHNPVIYKLCVKIGADSFETSFGLREFKANGLHFEINGTKTFLRGKHDGMLFPLSGSAPTDLAEWLRLLGISKSYGINHYRYHTCCPPKSAFEAADLLGIYMEPQLPFWGTLYAPDEENYNESEQSFLIREGERILNSFGNHASFCMMSLGNELWGSAERMGEIIAGYKSIDNRHLYTQGSNNFQWWPRILPEDDFFVGVRFDIDRRLRGSYAMCDAPLGYVQTDRPSTTHSYDNAVIPEKLESKNGGKTEIEIQYGTGVKKVEAEASGGAFVPEIPVVTHEIGQYGVYPNYDEIQKYTGVTRARNLEIFRCSLEKAGMLDMADSFFKCSGKLAMQCYKDELETAIRSDHIAGYQILDLQDFNGQGTALVGILDSFMDNKGIMSCEEWNEFCSDAVILAEFDKYNFTAGERFTAKLSVAWYRDYPLENRAVSWSVSDGASVLASGVATIPNSAQGRVKCSEISFAMPNVKGVKKLELSLKINGEGVKNHYPLWVYEDTATVDLADGSVIEKNGVRVQITTSFEKAKELLKNGERCILLPQNIPDDKKIKGTYCTDFWNFPMFASISRSMNKPIPIGTMGLVVNNSHPSVSDFATDDFTTPQWYDIIENSDCAILDETPIRPMLQMIDNVERNHKLGILFETSELGGKLLVCTSRIQSLLDRVEVRAFANSIVSYALSEEFLKQKLV